MTDDLHTRAEAIAAGMTKGPWSVHCAYGSQGINALKRVCIAPCVEPEGDATGIVLLANLRHEMLAVVRAARLYFNQPLNGCTRDCICHDGDSDCDCGYAEGCIAIDELDGALRRELGETP